MPRENKNRIETERIQGQKEVKKFKGAIKYNVELNEEQKEAKRLIRENQIVVITGRAGSGKAQPLHSKILTPNGWTTMGEIKIDDKVITQSGEETKVIGVFPQGEKLICKVSFSDNTSVECCDEHLWAVKNYKNRNKRRGSKNNQKKINTDFEIKETKDLINNLYKIEKHCNKINYNIPIVDAIQFSKKELLIDPYLLGLLLCDGSFRNSISYCSEDEDLMNYVKNNINDYNCDYSIKPNSNHNYQTIVLKKEDKNKENKLLSALIEYKLMHEKSEHKFIPQEYLFSSIEDRICLLQGLMDTDGSTTGVSTTFHTSSEQLKNNVIELIYSLGGTATFNTRIPKYKYKGKLLEGLLHYNISIKLPNNINPFKLQRKADKYIPKIKYGPIRYITNIEYIGKKEAQCIAVEDESHLYITDNYTVTHNSLVGAQTALDCLFKKEYKNIIVTRALVEVGTSMGFLPGDKNDKFYPYMEAFVDNLYQCYDMVKIDELLKDGLIKAFPVQFVRGKTVNEILIVEEAQNLSKEEMLAILTRLGKTGKIIINGDNAQQDTKYHQNGLQYVIELSKKIEEIKWVKLKENHRSDLVGKILETEYGNK